MILLSEETNSPEVSHLPTCQTGISAWAIPEKKTNKGIKKRELNFIMSFISLTPG